MPPNSGCLTTYESIIYDTLKGCQYYLGGDLLDNIEAYQEAGIERLLDDIYRVQEEEINRGDTNAIVIRVDLERALKSRCMTPRERQCLALYYFACLNMGETAKILGISIPSVHYRLKKAMPQVANHMSGELVVTSQAMRCEAPSGDTPLDHWLTDVLVNEENWFKVPEPVWDQINAMYPPELLEYKPAEVDYNWRGEATMKSIFRRREMLRSEIHPYLDNYGSKSGGDGAKQKLINVM